MTLKLKTTDTVEQFKSRLDVLLEGVPDEPDSYTRAAQSNSLVHQLDYRAKH